MKCSVLAVIVMCLMVVTCEETQRVDETQGNQLSENQVLNFQNSLSLNFNLYTDSVEKMTERKCVDSLPNVVTNNTEILDRLSKLEIIATTLLENQKSMDDEINVLNSSYSELANNTRKPIEKLQVQLQDPCKTASTSGVFKIQQLNQNVYCEVTTFGGGWMVFQQRVSKQGSFELSFNRTWAEFRAGFGTVGKDTDFWLGLEALHQITSSRDYEFAMEIKGKYGKYAYARYSQFHVAGEDDKYRLTVSGYSGTASDQLSKQSNMQFSTLDSDNDISTTNCAETFWFSGWWYATCGHICSPNYFEGPYWHTFNVYENRYIFGTYIRMMIRRK